MAITRIKNSSIANRGPKYDTALAGLPYRPVIGTATDGGTGTTVSVAFTENNSAGAGITYTALSSPGSLTGTGFASPVTVSGLTSGTAYTFQVKAGNSLGDSAYSAASNSVTPVQPTAFESIATATGTGSSGTITFSSIPSTYTHLQIRGIGQAASGGIGGLQLTFNSDTSTNYVIHQLQATGAAVAASGYTSQSYIWAGVNSSTGAGTGIPVSIIDILDYGSTSKYKTTRSLGGVDNNGSGQVRINSGLWMSLSAVSSITLKNEDGVNWTTNATFALYGIKESS